MAHEAGEKSSGRDGLRCKPRRLLAICPHPNVLPGTLPLVDRAACSSKRSAAFLLGLTAAFGSVVPTVAIGAGDRHVVSLDGVWDIDESRDGARPPAKFTHQGPVPGLAHSATPAFAEVDQFQSKQLLSSLVYYDKYSQSDYDRLGPILGLVQQPRNYFWYHKDFDAPEPQKVAIVEVAKAQFGTVLYLNGVRIGQHDSCFTAGYFDVSRFIRWGKKNSLTIRIGAHPGVLPATVTGGTDFEKIRWTPGIYDSVSLIATNNPVITTVQVVPQPSLTDAPSSVLIQTELRNYARSPLETTLRQQIVEWKSGVNATEQQELTVHLGPGEIKTMTQTLSLPAAHLWSPEHPFLYQVNTRTDGDRAITRFGMREFHFDTVTQRAYLNGKPFFLRGSNIALHRFFEDPESNTLPWTEAWVQRLLVDIPKQLHWNAFRFTIGPVPQRWLDIADETGLLIEYEYAVWVGSPVYTTWRAHYDTGQMINEYTEWMRDSWNHPSIVIWDATNESTLPEFAERVLPAVRALDLSNRPWENSYNAPGDPNDPVEDHTYFLESVGGKFDASQGGKPFELSDLEWIDGPAANPFTKSGHAKILNEYGWMWLNRDGSPTLLTEHLFPKLLGPADSVETRRALSAQVLGAETELWRSYRRYAGVMHFVYLSASEPGGFTSDNFVDIRALKLEPHFEAAIQQAFKPLGVYLNVWHTQSPPGDPHAYEIYLVNDEAHAKTGTLQLSFSDTAGSKQGVVEVPFNLPAWGAQNYILSLQSPRASGHYILQASAQAADDPEPTVSRRELQIQSP